MNRRDFILSTSSLLIAPTALLAQDQPKPATPDLIFADFESGTYDGWTLTGNCWTPEPYSDQRFPGKITGFEGKRFLCTYHPKRGCEATGKAVSSEFTIERPFINFLIGGGYYPGEACLNLIIDGTIARTHTGSFSEELRLASWDVSRLIGTRARLEALDTTQSQDLGYIVLDEIAFSDAPRDKSLLDIESGPSLNQLRVSSNYCDKSNVRFVQAYGYSDLSPLFDFGVTPWVFRNLVDVVCTHAYRLPHDPSRPIGETGQLLRTSVDVELTKQRIINPSLFLKQWLHCEAMCAYITSKITYDFGIVEKTLGKGQELENYRSRMQSVDVVYRTRLATCSGFGRITERFAQLFGIKCWHIDGATRRSDGEAWEGTNHGWVVFELDGGIRIPADTTVMWTTPVDYTQLTTKNGWRTMPATKRAWELFNAEYYNTQVDEGKPSPNKLSLTNLTCDEWRQTNSLRNGCEAARSYLDRQAGRHIGSYWNGCNPDSPYSFLLSLTEQQNDVAYNPGDREFPRASASFTSKYDQVSHVNDGIISYGDHPRNRWTAFGSPNSSDWVQIEFGALHNVSDVTLFFFDDPGTGGVRLPASFAVYLFADEHWSKVGNAQRIPLQPSGETANTITFSAKLVSALRVVMVHGRGGKSGLSEVVVRGEAH